MYHPRRSVGRKPGGGPEGGALILLVSGEQEVLESERDVLETIGQSINYFGPIGRSAVFKLANNQLAAALIRAMGESIALCEAAGVDRTTAVEALSQTASRVCALKKEKLAKRDWSTDFALELMYKDLAQAQQTAASLNVEMPLLQAVAGVHRKAAQTSLAQKDFAAIAEPHS